MSMFSKMMYIKLTLILGQLLYKLVLQDGLQRARELDEALDKSGRLKGPFIAWSSNSYKIEFSGIDAI